LTGLTTLNLERNQIKDISILKDFVHLQALLVSENQIEDITPLMNLSNLTEFQFINNPFFEKLPKNLQQQEPLDALHQLQKKADK
ncbi:MAG TPA: leucine-rich repeat domain-containing protein, partial [Leptospiraceae bacterium]|nr:leucine-rich repeat domain-containing protein [Leptospiraceae bacterium]